MSAPKGGVVTARREWERVVAAPYLGDDGEPGGWTYTDRMPVPGGWIYRTYRHHYNQSSESSVFVPYAL